jgi:hypothetical protein
MCPRDDVGPFPEIMSASRARSEGPLTSADNAAVGRWTLYRRPVARGRDAKSREEIVDQLDDIARTNGFDMTASAPAERHRSRSLDKGCGGQYLTGTSSMPSASRKASSTS